MAASNIPAPGTEFGPCEGECKHIDCAVSRKMAAMTCRICGEPIGYERGYFVEQATVPPIAVHSACLSDEIGR